jgi:hypothetical protein
MLNIVVPEYKKRSVPGNSGNQEETRIWFTIQTRPECQPQKLSGLRTEESIPHTQQNILTHSAVESSPSDNEYHELWLLK